jgi:uncharacterized protein DUF6510
MDALKLDGNAAAGALQEVFALEVTAASGTCDACGAVGAVGELMLYVHAPGLVFRCPHCEAVVLRIVTDGNRYWLDARGLRSLELTSG